MKIAAPTPEGIAKAAGLIRAGEIVAYPTETVYGFGVDPFSEDALRALYRVKGRDPNSPVLLIVSKMEQLDSVVSDVSPRAAAYAAAFWPGPLSLLFPRAPGLPEALSGDGARVCVRWTSCGIAVSLCEAFGGAIVSTSANASGEAPAMSPGEIDSIGIALCLDGGRLEASPPSTVLDPDTGEVIREGAVTPAQLAEVELP